MDSARLRDIFAKGMGKAAQAIGENYDVYRPTGTGSPLALNNRVMRLPVILDDLSPGLPRYRGFGRAMRATFDAISSRLGDYLVGPRGTLFVASLPAMERPLCVLTNTTMDVLRARGPQAPGLNAYGGASDDNLDVVLSGWPVQITSGGGAGSGALPADGGRSSASVLFPIVPASIRVSDILQDVAGRRFVIRSTDETEVGWQLSVESSEV